MQRALGALDVGVVALEKLEMECCEPGRSPSMLRLAETLAAARAAIGEIGQEESKAIAAIALLEDAGAQVGRLQVGCCAPNRMPLYAELLEALMMAQRRITGSLRLDHGGTASHEPGGHATD